MMVFNMTLDERLERLTSNIEARDRQIEAHDRQIEAHDRRIEAHRLQMEAQQVQIEALNRSAAAAHDHIRALAGTFENILGPLAASIAAHDNQIEALLKNAEATDRAIQELKEMHAHTEREWQAYLRRLPRH